MGWVKCMLCTYKADLQYSFSPKYVGPAAIFVSVTIFVIICFHSPLFAFDQYHLYNQVGRK